MRIRTSGASGGQNGLKDIIQKLSSDNFNRIKIGIGRPHNKNKNLADYVLEPFVNEDKRKIDKVIDKAVEVLIDLMNGKSVTALMNNYNITVK
jgi:PTH1 family peptidyl-tRNA hydrolase